MENFKVVLIGETGVGKSCLIERYINNSFNENFAPTLGASYLSKEVNFPNLKKSVKLSLWDTAGQEKYRSITKLHYKDASAVLLIYDITRRDSFNEIKFYWYKEVIENMSNNVVLYLVGNKTDFYEYEEVSKAEGQEYATEIHALFKETSAKTGKGIEEMFRTLAMKLLAPANYEELLQKEDELNEKRENLSKLKESMLDFNARENHNNYIEINRNDKIDNSSRCC